VIEAADLPLPTASDPIRGAEHALDGDRPIDLEQVEKALIERALQRTSGNVSAAARLLSIGREALRYRMAKFGLQAGEGKEDRSQNSGDRGRETED
jgi:DNA-binding NtrC family response regulator